MTSEEISKKVRKEAEKMASDFLRWPKERDILMYERAIMTGYIMCLNEEKKKDVEALKELKKRVGND